MNEIGQIAEAATRSQGEPLWLATVVAVTGSAYRRPGARLLFSREGKLAGSISGGCLDREVLRTGSWLASKGAVLRVYDASRDDDGEGDFRSGCNGVVELLIQPVTPELSETLQLVAEQLRAQRRIVLATVVSSSSLQTRLGEQLTHSETASLTRMKDAALARRLSQLARSALLCDAARGTFYRDRSLEALIEVLEPAPQLVVFGAGEDVVPVVRLARSQGFEVTVSTAHAGFAVRDRFSALAQLEVTSPAETAARLAGVARPLALVMTHDYEQDREALDALLGSSVQYIGVLGPARRTARLLSELRAQRPLPEQRLACVYGPAGLHLGGDTPEAIALSIVAEMQAVLARAGAGFLRDRRAGIHEADVEVLRLVEAGGA